MDHEAIYVSEHGRRLLKISGGAQVCFTNSPGRQSQRIQNAADDKVSAPKTLGTDGVELQGVHSPVSLLISKNLFSQNKTDHIQLNRLHYVSKMRRREALWKTINIHKKFLGPNEYLLMLIKHDYSKWFKS
jgi:hypothetical protein